MPFLVFSTFYFWQCIGRRGSVSYFREDVNADGNDVYFEPLPVSNYSLQKQARFDTPFITTTHDDETNNTSCLTVFYYNQIIYIETPSLVVSSSLFFVQWPWFSPYLKVCFLNLWPFLICNASKSRTALMSPLCRQSSLSTSWEKTDSFFAWR